MLAYIKGILEIKTKGYIVVEAGGLGYKIFMPESTIAKTGNIGDKVQIPVTSSRGRKNGTGQKMAPGVPSRNGSSMGA